MVGGVDGHLAVRVRERIQLHGWGQRNLGTQRDRGGRVFAWVGVLQGDAVLRVGGAVVAAAALGFLPWNVRKAWVFLGDTGSYALGAGIAALSGYAMLLGSRLKQPSGQWPLCRGYGLDATAANPGR